MQPLAGSFLRLALQLLARFQTWLLDGLAARSAALSAPAAESGNADKAASAWAAGAKAEQLCSVRADAEKIIDWLNSDYTQHTERLLAFTSQEVHIPSDGLNVAGCQPDRTTVYEAIYLERSLYVPHPAAALQHAGT